MTKIPRRLRRGASLSLLLGNMLESISLFTTELFLLEATYSKLEVDKPIKRKLSQTTLMVISSLQFVKKLITLKMLLNLPAVGRRYIRDFEAVKLLSQKFDDLNTISLVTRLSKSVVSQYIDLLPADY